MTVLLLFLLVLAPTRLRGQQIPAPFRQEFSCPEDQLFYRTLYLHGSEDGGAEESALFVGGMDAIFRLDPANVSSADCVRDSLPLPATNVANCVSKGKSEDFDCRNHVRVIQAIGGNRLYVCGTNAHSPRDLVIYANLTHLARHEFYPGVGDGIAKCPFDPEDNSTAVWVEDGNPGGHPALYSGTNAEFTKADTVIFRGDIFDERTGRREYSFKRTLKYDSHMLDKPDFVGAYDVGEYVYFFFRETAVEFMNCGVAVYSRVARVCKRDVGGKNILHQNWATYLKARLNCSVPGEFPFFFNEIQDVYKSPEDDSLFHAVFTTGANGLTGSAICTFNLRDLERVFDEGKFKEQSTSTSMWLPVLPSRVPEPRPGQCVEDTRRLPDTVLNFIRSHPLMDGDAPHDGYSEGPVFYLRDVVFTRLAVERVSSGSPYGRERSFHIYYAGTADGRIYKVSRWRGGDDGQTGRFESKLLDVFEVTTPDPVRAITLSKRHRSLYVASDRSVQQVSLDLCHVRYTNCLQCIRDPHCGWDGEAGNCKPKHYSLQQDPAGEAPGLCDASAPTKQISANFGSSVYLPCELNRMNDADKVISWFHFDSRSNKRRVRIEDTMDYQDKKHVLTTEGGLVILGVTERDAGRYQCRLGRQQVISGVQLTVDAHRCAAPNKTADYQRVYSEWCQEFQKYRNALQRWEKRQNKCAALSAPEVLSSYSPLV